MLKKIDEKKLAFIPAAQLSYLRSEEQEWLHDILCREENFGISMAQAQKLKGISQNGILTYEKIDKIIISKNHEPPKTIKLSYKAIRDFFHRIQLLKNMKRRYRRLWRNGFRIIRKENIMENTHYKDSKSLEYYKHNITL